MTARGSFFPRRVNNWFANAKYAQDVSEDGATKVRIPALAALNATGFLSAVSIAVAVDTTTFAAAYDAKEVTMGKFGRNVTVVASGAATSAVSVYGQDYLGQPMMETLTLAGTTPVIGKKAFRYVTRVTAAVTAATTINLGWGNVLGLPYKAQKLELDLVSGVSQAAGTLVAADITTATATTGDTRGTYAPNASYLTDGTRYYDILYYADNNNLYSVAHFAG
jgi:hypothetical protein